MTQPAVEGRVWIVDLPALQPRLPYGDHCPDHDPATAWAEDVDNWPKVTRPPTPPHPDGVIA